jgi:hypothetical protein
VSFFVQADSNSHSHADLNSRYAALDKLSGELSSLSSRIVKDKLVRDAPRGWMGSMEGFA